jgi:hypothetical protein
MPWQGIALSTELLPHSDKLEDNIINLAQDDSQWENFSMAKKIVMKSLKKWLYLMFLGLLMYLLGYSVALSLRVQKDISEQQEIIKNFG